MHTNESYTCENINGLGKRKHKQKEKFMTVNEGKIGIMKQQKKNKHIVLN